MSSPVHGSASADLSLLTAPGSTAASGNPLDARIGAAALDMLYSRNTSAASQARRTVSRAPFSASHFSSSSSSSSLGAPKLASGSGSPDAANPWFPHLGVQAGYHHGGLEAAAAAGTSHTTVATESDSGSPKAASPAPAPAQEPSYAQRVYQALASVVNYIKSTVVSIWNFFFSRTSS
jgi:hypothetical protein